MNVILFGYRGSGKTTLGLSLAGALGWNFVDTDQMVMADFGGRSIADIWNTEGEPAFRAAEVHCVKKAVALDATVAALGGGALMQAAAREAVQAAVRGGSVGVYLRCEPEELHRRIHEDAHTAGQRPNLTALGGGLDEIVAVLSRREPVYQAAANLVVDVTHLGPQEGVRVILEKCPQLRIKKPDETHDK